MDSTQTQSPVSQETRLIMGMPITVAVIGLQEPQDLEDVFAYFTSVDERFSTYKPGSEISRINRHDILPHQYSSDMGEVFALAEQTKRESNGYFDIRRPDGALDPSGIVKGWAIRNAAALLRGKGYEHFFIDAGGDIQAAGLNGSGKPWSVGIRNPFDRSTVLKTVYPEGAGVATSGTYVRGQHIYNPHAPESELTDIISLTVIAPDILEADRFATAAFAMGLRGAAFIESLPHCEAYAVDAGGRATMTSGFGRYTKHTPT